MFLLRITLLLAILPFLAAYPMKAQAKPGQKALLFPDLTHGLSDAEVESTLNGLSLDDLNNLNNLLDDAGSNGPIELEASLRGHHRQAAKKQQRYEEMESGDEDMDPALNSNNKSYEDACHDEDETEKEQCTEQPKCKKRPQTTKRCFSQTTKRCATTACKSLDGFLDIHVDSNKYDSKQKYEDPEECDPEDTMCLQRNQQRYKHRPGMHDFAEISIDQGPGSVDSLEQLADEAHRDESLKVSKLNSWNAKDDASPDGYNNEFTKLTNANGNLWDEGKGMMSGYGEQPQQQNVDDEQKQSETYERHQLAREVREREEQADEMMGGSALDEDIQQQNVAQAADDFEQAESVPLANDVAANNGDSFIAINAREPVRYLIQTDNGYIKSENESADQLLRSDKQQSEMLNYENYQLSNNPSQNQLESKRIKRDSKKTDDELEIADESYIKKLMDSFPRDQDSQSSLNIAIRQAKRSHLRVKRS